MDCYLPHRGQLPIVTDYVCHHSYGRKSASFEQIVYESAIFGPELSPSVLPLGMARPWEVFLNHPDVLSEAGCPSPCRRVRVSGG